jgi:CBS domain containing-hemolysin-like protein
VAADRARIESDADAGDRSARRAILLMRRLSYHLSAAQFGITVTSLLLGFLAQPTVQRVLEALTGNALPTGVSVVIALTLATSLHMVFSEIVPKSVAIASADSLVRRISIPVRFYGAATRPFVTVLNNLSNWLTRLVGVEPKDEIEYTPSLEELALMIKSSGDQGSLDADEVGLLTRVIRFTEKSADAAMVPRVEMVALTNKSSVEDLVQVSIETGHSRFPVLGEGIDDVVGVVHVKSVYRIPIEGRSSASVAELMSEPLVVPESQNLDSLLSEMQETSSHIAIVVDEFGGTAGLITIEDLLEEIVGEIDDEYDLRTVPTRVERGGSFLLRASLHRDEVFDACGFQIPEGPFETIAGFVLDQVGHIPTPGEMIEHDGWRVEVVAVQRRRRITTVRISCVGSP